MTLVCSSSAKAVRKSVSDRSALLPMLMSLARPRWRAAAQSRMAVHSAPDCEMTEIPPGCGICLANEAFIRWWVLIRPRQFGPSMATRRALQKSAISFSSAAPSGPTSLKPAVMTTTALAPASIELMTACRTSAVGTAITLRSMRLPQSWRFGIALEAENLVRRRIHRDDDAAEAAVNQVGDHLVPDLAGGAGCADDGDRLGGQQRVEHFLASPAAFEIRIEEGEPGPSVESAFGARRTRVGDRSGIRAYRTPPFEIIPACRARSAPRPARIALHQGASRNWTRPVRICDVPRRTPARVASRPKGNRSSNQVPPPGAAA